MLDVKVRVQKLVLKERRLMDIRFISGLTSLAKCKQGSCIENVFTRIISGQVCRRPSGAPGGNSTDFTVDTMRVFNAIDEKSLNRHSAEVRLTKRGTSFNRK